MNIAMSPYKKLTKTSQIPIQRVLRVFQNLYLSCFWVVPCRSEIAHEWSMQGKRLQVKKRRRQHGNKRLVHHLPFVP